LDDAIQLNVFLSAVQSDESMFHPQRIRDQKLLSSASEWSLRVEEI